MESCTLLQRLHSVTLEKLHWRGWAITVSWVREDLIRQFCVALFSFVFVLVFGLFCMCGCLVCSFLFVNAQVFCKSEFTDAVDGVELGFFAFMWRSVNHAHLVGLAAPVGLCPFGREVQVLSPRHQG